MNQHEPYGFVQKRGILSILVYGIPMNCHFNREDYDSPSSFGVSRKQNQANPYHSFVQSLGQVARCE